MASGGEGIGVSAEVFSELTAPPRPPTGNPRDLVLWVPAAYSLGFVRPSEGFTFGRGARSFGHPGAGGSFGFADPEAEVGFAYAPNRLGHHLRDDPREKRLRDALYSCLDRAPSPAAVTR
jgi:CubicO group peptidase (beta-lactamase class C family)